MNILPPGNQIINQIMNDLAAGSADRWTIDPRAAMLAMGIADDPILLEAIPEIISTVREFYEVQDAISRTASRY